MDQNVGFPKFPMHYRGLLLLTGIYTASWSALYRMIGPELLQWLSLGVSKEFDLPYSYFGGFGILLGLVIFVSAFYPVSWVWLILAGITGKLITATWFVLGFIPELDWNKRTIFHLVFNELIWLIPLILIFLRSLQVKSYLKEFEEKS